MQILKFGGASVKDADAIINLKNILINNIAPNAQNKVLIVISALGKTTNALEIVATKYFNKQDYKEALDEIIFQHTAIANTLNCNIDYTIFKDFINYNLKQIEHSKIENYDAIYDQIVSLGELFSTYLISKYLNENGLLNDWLDIRNIIKTDSNFRDVNIDWQTTETLCTQHIQPLLQKNNCIITQGFIGGTANNLTTTLGREGSDYTASILAYCLNANQVSIWKDVPGVMNADPKIFEDAVYMPALSYYEAIEMAYYGAQVIHPKTIKPLQNKQIPLFVKSFLDVSLPGTKISNFEHPIQYPPIKVFKPNQILISLTAKDFSFIAEKHLIKIFTVFANARVRLNVMQNGAISFSVAVDASNRIEEIVNQLQAEFKILVNDKINLITIRHYNNDLLNEIFQNKKIILEQRSRSTIQLLYNS